MCIYLSVGRCCHGVSTLQDAVMKLYRTIVEIKMYAEFEDDLDLKKGGEVCTALARLMRSYCIMVFNGSLLELCSKVLKQ